MDQRDDLKLHKRTVQGDLAALSALYDRYISVLYSLSLRILASQEHAETLSGDIFLELWNADAASVVASRGLYPWIIGRCRQKALELRRSREFQSRAREPEGEEAPAREADDESAPVADAFGEDRALVAARLKQLSRDHIRILKLAYFKGYGPVQIARMLRMPPGPVRGRLQDAVSALRGKGGRAPRPAQDHPQLQQCLGFVLGELTGSRRQQFEQHLVAKCLTCREEIAEIESAVHLLPLTLPPRFPSPELKQRVLAKASTSEKGTRGRAASGGASLRQWLGYSLVIVLVAVVGFGVVLYRSLNEQLDAQKQETARLHVDVKKGLEAVEILSREGVVNVPLSGAEAAPAARGFFGFDAASGTAVFAAADLAPLGPDTSYHIWYVEQGTDVHVGEFSLEGGDGSAIRILQWPAGVSFGTGRLLLTTEPRQSMIRKGVVCLQSSAAGQ